jgi:hypothetical protein
VDIPPILTARRGPVCAYVPQSSLLIAGVLPVVAPLVIPHVNTATTLIGTALVQTATYLATIQTRLELILARVVCAVPKMIK